LLFFAYNLPNRHNTEITVEQHFQVHPTFTERDPPDAHIPPGGFQIKVPFDILNPLVVPETALVEIIITITLIPVFRFFQAVRPSGITIDKWST